MVAPKYELTCTGTASRAPVSALSRLRARGCALFYNKKAVPVTYELVHTKYGCAYCRRHRLWYECLPTVTLTLTSDLAS